MLPFKVVAGICTLNNKWYLFGLSLSAKIPGQNACWTPFLLQNSLWMHKCWGFGLWWDSTRLVLRWSPWWAAGDGNGLTSMVESLSGQSGNRAASLVVSALEMSFLLALSKRPKFLSDHSTWFESFGFWEVLLKLWAIGCAPSSLVQVRFWCFHWFWGGGVLASRGKAGWWGARWGTFSSEQSSSEGNPIARLILVLGP